jgi:hypothetical protein
MMAAQNWLIHLLFFILACIYSGASEIFQNVQSQNEEAMSMLSELLQDKDGWQLVGKKDGVTVERRYLDPGSYVAESDRVKSGKHACVRSKGTINAPAQAVFDLFVDNTRVSEYNEHCSELKDVAEVHRDHTGRQWTKISWVIHFFVDKHKKWMVIF